MSNYAIEKSVRDREDGARVLVVRITGRISIDTVGPLESDLEAVFGEGTRLLVLDFAEVDRVDSRGIGILVKLTDRFDKDGGKIVLASCRQEVIDLFDVLGLGDVFASYPTVDDAVAGIA